jgi:phage gp29-like protein
LGLKTARPIPALMGTDRTHMNILKTVVAAVRNLYGSVQDAAPGGPPTQRQNWLGPRFEPINISSNATVQDVQSAIRQAENGDTTSLFRFYRDSLLGDEHIQGEINKRKLAVIGQVTAVLPEDKSNEDDLAAAAACLRAVKDCENWTHGMSALLSGTQWPVALAENVFRATTSDDGPVRWATSVAATPVRGAAKPKQMRELNLQYTLKRVEPVNQMLFCFRHAYLVGGVGFGSATPLQQAGMMRKADGTSAPAGDWSSVNLEDWEPFLRLWPIDDQGRIIYDASRASKLDQARHVVHRGHLMAEHKDNWGGPFRAITFWWLLRGLGRDWFARFMERYGSPFPVGKTNVQDPESVSLLQQAFALSTKIGGLVIGQEDQVELVEAATHGGAEGHNRWHTVCNNAISRHITGFAMSDKSAGLNAGEATVQEGVREDIRIFDQRMLAETLEKQLFARFLKFNGLPGKIRVAWGGLSAEDATLFATLLKTIGDAGFEPTDEAIPVVQEKLGIEVRRKAADYTEIVQQDDLDQPNATVPGDIDHDGDVDTLAVNRLGKLIYFSAGGGKRPRPALQSGAHETDKIAAAKAEALGKVYKGAMAPFREIILRSDSREQCLKALSAAYRDWKPERLASELEAALQVCAAAGAHAGNPKEKTLNR